MGRGNEILTQVMVDVAEALDIAVQIETVLT